MSRRGQVTLIILVSIFVIASLLIGLYINSRLKKSQIVPGRISNTDYIENYVTMCLENSGKDAFRLLGARGGFIAVPYQVNSIHIGEGRFMYLVYDKGIRYIQPIEATEAEVSMFVEDKVKECFESQNFSDYGRAVNYIGAPTITTLIGKESVSIKMYQPIEVEEIDGEVRTLEEFSVQLPIRYGLIIETLEKISDQLLLSDLKQELVVEKRLNGLVKDQPPISLSFMYYNDYPEDMDVNFVFFDGPLTLWKITDHGQSMEYSFIFAAHHMMKEI